MESKNVSGTDFLSSVCWKQNHRCIGGSGIDQRRDDARSLNRVFQSQHATILFSNFHPAFQVVYGCAKIASLNCNDGSTFWGTTNRSVKVSQMVNTREIKYINNTIPLPKQKDLWPRTFFSTSMNSCTTLASTNASSARAPSATVSSSFQRAQCAILSAFIRP